MTSQLERLRRLQGMRRQSKRGEPALPLRETSAAEGLGDAQRLQDVVAGEVIENHAGTCYLVTRRYPLDAPRGSHPLGALLDHTTGTLATLHPKFGLTEQGSYLSAAFLDTETTGLGGGAGVYAFMVGVGLFEAEPVPGEENSWPADAMGIPALSQKNNPNIPNAGRSSPPLSFVVHQLFMRSPAEEGALLVALGELLHECEMTVTFNGRTFDLPLLRTRYQQNHWLFPAGLEEVALLAPDRAHLDLLQPARRLWRKRLKSCRLINLEMRVLGLQRTEQDVPGALIPQLYVDYSRGGDAREMARVFYHNREDIVSMPALTNALSRAFSLQPSTADAHALPGMDWLALGRYLEQRGTLDEAATAYRHAADNTSDTRTRSEAFAQLGRLRKRQARWEDATAVWQEWLGTAPQDEVTPFVELAKYCEWQAKDLDQAEMWTGWALHNLQTVPAGLRNHSAVAELTHRLARIRRKQMRSVS